MTYYTYKATAAKHALPGQVVKFQGGKGYYVYGKAKPQKILLRNRLITLEEAAVKLNIREVGGNNHGPWVKKFLAEVGLPEGYAWCAAFQSYELHRAAGHKLPIESASVENFYSYGRSQGWNVTRPLRGDLVCYDFDGDGRFNDHIGLVIKVLAISPGFVTLRTVEGNTGDQNAADGDGVYERVRVMSRKRVAFVRIPGYAT